MNDLVTPSATSTPGRFKLDTRGGKGLRTVTPSGQGLAMPKCLLKQQNKLDVVSGLGSGSDDQGVVFVSVGLAVPERTDRAGGEAA